MSVEPTTIAPVVRKKMDDIVRLCVECKVRVLEVFGSAATDTMRDDSDIDFLSRVPAHAAGPLR